MVYKWFGDWKCTNKTNTAIGLGEATTLQHGGAVLIVTKLQVPAIAFLGRLVR